MAYFRTLKSGEVKLIYTASDRVKQMDRQKAKRFDTDLGWLYQEYTRIKVYEWDKKTLYYWTLNKEVLSDIIEDLQYRERYSHSVIAKSLMFERTGKYIEGSCPGGLQYARGILFGVQNDLRHYQTIARLINMGAI